MQHAGGMLLPPVQTLVASFILPQAKCKRVPNGSLPGGEFGRTSDARPYKGIRFCVWKSGNPSVKNRRFLTAPFTQGSLRRMEFGGRVKTLPYRGCFAEGKMQTSPRRVTAQGVRRMEVGISPSVSCADSSLIRGSRGSYGSRGDAGPSAALLCSALRTTEET